MAKLVGQQLVAPDWQWQPGSTHDPRPPLEVENPAVPRGRSALVIGAIIVAAWAAPQLSALRVNVATESGAAAAAEQVPARADQQVARAAAWQPASLSALRLSTATETGPVVEQAQPPKAGEQQVARHAAWRVTWDTQQRPKAIVSVDNPPPRRLTPSVEAWRVTWSAQSAPKLTPPSVDNPPGQRATPSVEAWRQTWAAQRAPLFVPQPAGAAVDDPPARTQAVPAAVLAWQPATLTALKVSTATEGGAWTLPAAADNPPPFSRGWMQAVLAANQPPRFGSYSSSVYTSVDVAADDPPRSVRVQPTAIRAWEPPTLTSLRVSTATEGGDWTLPIPTADDPPFRLQTMPAAVLAWQPPSLTALRFSTATEGGDWVLTPPQVDDPPPRQQGWMQAVLLAHRPPTYGSYGSSVYTHVDADSAPRSVLPNTIWEQWQAKATWQAPQRAKTVTAGYVAPAVDNPPPRVVQPTTIREQWQERASWQVPQRLPTVTESGPDVPPVVVVPEVAGGWINPSKPRPVDQWRKRELRAMLEAAFTEAAPVPAVAAVRQEYRIDVGSKSVAPHVDWTGLLSDLEAIRAVLAAYVEAQGRQAFGDDTLRAAVASIDVDIAAEKPEKKVKRRELARKRRAAIILLLN